MRLSFEELQKFRSEYAHSYKVERDNLEYEVKKLTELNQSLQSAVDGIDMRIEGIKERLEADGLSVAKYVMGLVHPDV